jgi:ATP phosphoribosyltransferase
MLKIAVPNKGRMYKPTINLLKNSDLEPKDLIERKLYAETNNNGIKIIFLRTEEIGSYVQSGIADLGITGYDIVIEKNLSVENILDLNYGRCQLVLAGPDKRKIQNGIRIATKYPKITRKYLRRLGINGEIIVSSGATEIKPQLGLSDFIVDLKSTGSTLKMNGLKVYDTLLESKAVLVGNKKSIVEKQKEIEIVKLVIESVILAENRSYVMFNISKKILNQVIGQIPCMRAPTIVKTGDDSVVAIQTVVPNDDISKIIMKLKSFGTSDILVLDIKRVVI